MTNAEVENLIESVDKTEDLWELRHGAMFDLVLALMKIIRELRKKEMEYHGR